MRRPQKLDSSATQRGFTLIELMITIVVLGILVGIALPSYQNSVRKSHRTAAQGEMFTIADRMQQYLLTSRAYPADLATLGYSVPADVAERYSCSLTSVDNSGVPSFTISCVPTSAQAADSFSTLTLNNLGAKSPSGEW